jgi:YhgE/Pip-like protein
MNALGNTPDPHHGTLRSARFWVAPVVVVTAVMAALAYFYLGSMLNPTENLRKFPMAIVNQDVGDVMPGSDESRSIGAEITAAILDGVDPDDIDLQEMGISAAHSGLDTGSLYGAIVIPSDFTKRTSILAQGSVVPGDIEKPVITVYTNPRNGTFSAAIVDIIGERAMATVNRSVGEELTDTVTTTLAESAPDQQLSGGSRLTLAEPINVLAVEYRPLPEGTGAGLSAFYYTLLLILAGFTGATIVNALVDSALGFVPTEYGPCTSAGKPRACPG